MRFVAVGDSFTEGVGDQLPDGSVRGWADLVATGLAAASAEPVHYANLAIRGRLLAAIVEEQIPHALSLDPLPDLITINGGGNDIMRPGTDIPRLIALTEQAVDRCLAAGVRPVLLAGADPTGRLPFGRTMHARAAEHTAGVGRLAAAEGVAFVNCFDDPHLPRAHYWSPDRLHLNAHGHRRVADLVLTGLDVPVEPADVLDRAEPPRAFRTEARFYREHVAPWIGRRVRRRSSGDGRTGKHADWTLVRTAESDSRPH